MNRTHIISTIIKKFKLFSFLVFILCLSSISTAQTKQLKFTKIEGSNGVTLGKVNTITQDQNGFMWFSDQTNGAIIRYDGNHMTQYRHDPNDPESLGGDYPECLFADPAGNIWVGAGGLDMLDPVSGTFTHYRHDPNDPESLSSNGISAIHMDHLGYLWVGTGEGLDRLDLKTGKFDHFRHDPNDSTSLSYNGVRAIYEDREGTLWIGTGVPWEINNPAGGLNKFDRSKGTFTRYLHDPANANSLVSNKVRAIFEDSKGNFWVGSDKDGLHTLDRKSGKFTRYSYDPKHPEKLSRPPANDTRPFNHITFILEDADEKIWIGTAANGINRYDPENQKITYFGNDADKTGTFLDNSGWWAYASNDGLVWLATEDGENLYKIDLQNIHIPHFEVDGLNRSILEEAPFIMWMGTRTGLVRKNLKNGTSQRFVHEPLNENSINHNWITELFKDKEGVIWVGTPFGLNRYDAETGNFTRYQHDPNDATSLSDNIVNAIIEDRDFNIWVGTETGGLNLLDRDTGKFTHYRKNDKDNSSIGDDMVGVILEGEKNELWIGSPNVGISNMDRKSGKFKHYLPGLTVNDLLKDKSGIIWAGTREGLYRYHKTLDDFYPLSKDSTGIDINSVVMSIIADNEDNLWISTLAGIYKLNSSRDNLVHFGKESGVIPADKDRLLKTTGYKGSDGKLFFVDSKGYYAFYPTEFNMPQDESPLYITSFWLNNRSLVPDKKGPLKESFFDTKEILLDHDQNEFAFTFTSIDYRTSASKTVYYQLENYDTDWREARVEDKVNYFRVPPGNYNFRLKAVNGRNGVWSEKSIAMIVTPPWWTNWWAYTIYGILFIAAIFIADRVQRRRLLAKSQAKAKEKELAQAKEIKKAYKELGVAHTNLKSTQSQLIQSEKMASLGELTAGIAHEIQNPLNFVNNFSEVNLELIEELKQERGKSKKDRDSTLEEELLTDIDQNLEKISHHGKRADAIVKGMLQHSRSSSGGKELTDINALADEYLRLAYHGLRAKDKSFNATMEIDFDENIGKINIIPQDIGRVVLNLITNAFYAVSERKLQQPEGYEPTVSVSTKKTGNKVFVSVKDNGSGIPKNVLDKIFQPFFTTKPTGEGTGLGLSLSYDIIKAHKGEISVKSKVGEGTAFTIALPVKAQLN